ncbi:hypothetical protein [Parasedimentitalea maritima]|uniref:Uncharacterized protein n=1 Tax=Parasedimentitalea maritima TaxID=2578117 RepID=A0A6A4RC50_9RHOB|nr:hypothetical protein [Zongyanglinia marina]KAE9627597.1 hypothetical protein GP644_18625 [Zongyanglinia marina]
MPDLAEAQSVALPVKLWKAPSRKQTEQAEQHLHLFVPQTIAQTGFNAGRMETVTL